MQQTKEEYIAEQCEVMGITQETFDEVLKAEPCDCGCLGCTGWLVFPKDDQ